MGKSQMQMLGESPFTTLGGMQDAKAVDEQSRCWYPEPPMDMTQRDSWDLSSTFRPGQTVLVGPISSGVDGVPVVLLHGHLNQMLGLTLARWILDWGQC